MYSASTATSLTLTLTNNTFDSMGTAFTDLSTNLNAITPTSSIGGAFNIHNAIATIQSYNNTYTNCYAGDTGGGFSLHGSTLNDTLSTYTNNAAIRGGAIYCNVCQLILKNITFNNNQAVKGGTFYMYYDIT